MTFVQKFLPTWLVLYIRSVLEPKAYKLRKKAVVQQYIHSDLLRDTAIQEGINFLKHYKFSAFPFKWSIKYETLFPKIFYDANYQMFYIGHCGHKLYFPKRYSRMQVIWATRSILKEQDPQSAHLYLTSDFNVDLDSIVIDAGVAEGNFSLSIIDRVKCLYLIECNPEWIETLKVTFAPWKEKVVFVEKYLSDSNDQTSTTLDNLISVEENEKYFVKMDIEGYEEKALKGMAQFFSEAKHLKMDICTYHHENDLEKIGKIVNTYGLKYHASDGYVLYSHTEDETPSFRKALIRAKK